MHELSIALSILDIVADEARRHGNARVCAVHVKVGPLAGVVKEALVSAFALAREGSACADASLLVEETPVVIRCDRCGVDRAIPSILDMVCPICGTPSGNVVSGRELEVTALEIEDAEPDSAGGSSHQHSETE